MWNAFAKAWEDAGGSDSNSKNYNDGAANNSSSLNKKFKNKFCD